MTTEPDGVDALLAQAKMAAEFNDPEERARLRKAAGLSLEQVAEAIGVSRSTVADLEKTSRLPSPPARTRYLRLLAGLAQIHPATAPPATASPEPPAEAAPPAAPQRAESPAARAARTGHQRYQAGRRTKSADQAAQALREMVTGAVEEELDRAQGDAEKAMGRLGRRAIPDVMELFKQTREGARYEHTAHPALPDIFHKPSKDEPDQIWEARPKWGNPAYRRHPDGDVRVTALDVNAAYLSALTVHLPIGKLEHSASGDYETKRAGVHLITPPAWNHPDLPNPLGDREEPGPLWITTATLRLLLRLSGPQHRLLDPPQIHESWTSTSSEGFFKLLQATLRDARADAIDQGDDVTEYYVKMMYSKLVSTMGESNDNRKIYRPDWMHNIRSQAFANLWGRALKARQAGLEVVAAFGTDELHVAGDWRRVFAEGRGLSEMKIKTDRNGTPVHYTAHRAGR